MLVVCAVLGRGVELDPVVLGRDEFPVVTDVQASQLSTVSIGDDDLGVRLWESSIEQPKTSPRFARRLRTWIDEIHELFSLNYPGESAKPKKVLADLVGGH